MKEMTTTVWFDRWLKDAEERRARRRQLEEIAEICGTILAVAGFLLAIVGVFWIDATAICRENVVISFVGVGLLYCGTRLKYYIEMGGLWP